MSHEHCTLLCLLVLVLASGRQIEAQDHEPDRAISDEMLAAAASIPRDTLEKLANLTQDESSGVWFLVPSNTSGDVQVNSANFELFKLNTNQLFDLGGRPQQDWTRRLDTTGDEAAGGGLLAEAAALQGQSRASLQVASPGTSRGARKLGLFTNVLHKPKVSPLYLVNGTVCRFVNSQPICTTLSTTGLFRGAPNQGFLTPQQNLNTQNQQQQNGLFSNLNNNNNNNNNQQQFPNSRQVSPPQNNFLQGGGGFQNLNMPNQQQQQQQFRPSALMDDEARAVNLTAKSSKGAEQSQQPPASDQKSGASKPAVPSYTIVQRRPISLLSLARPFRAARN